MRGGWRSGAATLAVLVATGLVGYRVLSPAETRTEAHEPYPPAWPATPGIIGELSRAPLIVDGRLRVYAAKRQVWADVPIRARTETTPVWSLRRWPHELVGVVAVPGPFVVSKWSDGALVATDGRTGGVAWRARSPVGERRYGGGRTGAATVYSPAGLHTGRTADGRTVVVSTGATGTAAFDAAAGSPLWTIERSCLGFTGLGFYEGCGRVDLATGRRLSNLPMGKPFGCTTGRSDCTALDTGWLLDSGEPVRALPLAAPGAWRVGDVAVAPSGTAVTARSLPGGALQWTWRAPEGGADRSRARIVAAEPGAVYLITERRTLVVLDPVTGSELTRIPLERFGSRTRPWTPGRVYARDRYVVIERLGHHPRPVLMAGT